MHRAVVELDALTDADGAGTKDQNLLFLGLALLGGLGVQLFLNSHADLVEAGVVELLDNGDLVFLALGLGSRGGSSCGGSGGSSGGGGGAAGGQRGGQNGERSDHRQKLFHNS